MGNSSVTPWSSARKIVCQLFRFIVSSPSCNRGKGLSSGDLLAQPSGCHRFFSRQRETPEEMGPGGWACTSHRCHRLMPSLCAGETSFPLPTRCTSDYLLADFGRVTRAATTEIAARMKKATAWVGCEASGGVVVSG